MTHTTPSIVFLILTLTINVSYQLEPRIVNGFNITTMKGYEYQVSLRGAVRDQQMFGSGHVCGGSLIDYDLVLTAAHCVHDGKYYYSASVFSVVMGNVLRYQRDNNTVVMSVRKIVGHKNYIPETFANDIALVYLSQNVPINHPTIKPIALSTISPPVGKSCVITGWGALFYEGPSPSILMGANVMLNSRSECNRQDRYNGNVLNGMFCAGSFTGKNISDSCQGDSGGPLACDGKLVGVTSNGVECARERFPGIYIDVNYYRGWIINGTIGNNNSSKLYVILITILSAIFILIKLK